MLYESIPDASRSNYVLRQNPRPHANDIAGSANVKSLDLVTSHLKELPLNCYAGGPSSFVSSNPTQSVDVHFMQSLTDPNGN
jgi:hypothetical protein